MTSWLFRLSPCAIAGSVLALAACGLARGEHLRSDLAEHPRDERGLATPAPGAAPAAPSAKRELRVATYNAGLAVGVLKYANERANPLVDALAEQPVDLLCVQEFWLDEHWQKLAAAMAGALPNTYRLPAENQGGTCDQSEVAPLVACAASRCASVPVNEVPMCLLHGCASQLSHLSADCFGCLTSHPHGRPDAIARACIAPRAPGDPRAQAKQRRGLADFRVYAGSYGTGILTNARVLERDARILPSTLDRRAVLYNRLATPVGEINAFCTHLTANLAGVPHPGPGNASWEQDQSEQIDALLAFVEEKAAGRPTLVLGDLNTGPAIAPAIAPSQPDHYARIVERGFLNPYAARQGATCTYCFDNPLDGGRGTRGLLIDHVLIRGFAGRAATEGQIMRPPVIIEPAGTPVRIGPSDHYGVSVTLVPSGS